jgi:superfamily II DNA or RNA helicase
MVSDQLDRIEHMLEQLCEKLGISATPERSVKEIGDVIGKKILNLQNRRKKG